MEQRSNHSLSQPPFSDHWKRRKWDELIRRVKTEPENGRGWEKEVGGWFQWEWAFLQIHHGRWITSPRIHYHLWIKFVTRSPTYMNNYKFTLLLTWYSKVTIRLPRHSKFTLQLAWHPRFILLLKWHSEFTTCNGWRHSQFTLTAQNVTPNPLANSFVTAAYLAVPRLQAPTTCVSHCLCQGLHAVINLLRI